MSVTIVQSVLATGAGGSNTSLAATLPSAVTAGNVVVVIAGFASNVTATLSYTDNKSNAYTARALINNFHASGNAAGIGIGTTVVTTGGSSFTVTASATWGTGLGLFGQLCLLEISGLDTLNLIDVSGTASQNTSTTSISPSITTTNANDIIIAAMAGDTNATAVTMSNPALVDGSATGVTSLEHVTSVSVLAFQVSWATLSVTGSHNASWTYNSDNSGAYAAAVVALQIAGGGAVTVHTYMMLGMGM